MNDNKMLVLTIDEKKVEVPTGTTILSAAAKYGIEIPTLCYLEGIEAFGGCRLCVVSVGRNGHWELKTACTELCADGMMVKTDSPDVVAHRRFVLDMLLSDHLSSCFNCSNHEGCKRRGSPLCSYDDNCFTCGKRDECKLREYALRYGLINSSFVTEQRPARVKQERGVFVYDANRCIRCRRCQRSCEMVMGESLVLVFGRGGDTVIQIPERLACKDCMKCVENCPTGALQVNG